MAMGEKAGDAIDRALTRHERVDKSDLARYERESKKLVARFRRFVYGFYDPVFFEAFCTEDPPEIMRKAVTTVLAGGVERVPLTRKIWTQLMFVGTTIDRVQRKIFGGGKKEEVRA